MIQKLSPDFVTEVDIVFVVIICIITLNAKRCKGGIIQFLDLSRVHGYLNCIITLCGPYCMFF